MIVTELKLKTPEGVIYRPLPAQAAFHKSSASSKVYLGGFGSGKTLCGAIETLVSALEQPNAKGGVGLVARYSYDELRFTTWQTLLDIIPEPLSRRCEILRRPLVIRLPNGFELRGYNLKNHQKMGSEKLSIAWVDECCEDGIEESIYLQLQGRMRNKVGPNRIILTGNPGGRNWVYQRFFAHTFDATAPRYPNHEGFRAGTQENVYLAEEYLQRMRDTYPEDWLEKYFSGSFDVFEGAILDNFRPDVHTVDPFFIAGEWPRFFGLDHGYTNPTAALWAAMDHGGNLLVYRNYYKRQGVVEENTRAIAQMEAGDPEPEWRVIDPSTRQTQQANATAERLIDQYRRAGLYCQEANNDVKGAIARIKSLLQPDPEHEFPAWHPKAGVKGAPYLYFTRDCKEAIWEAQQWKWRDLKPGAVNREKPLEKDDHAMAALRYLVMRSPRQAEMAVPKSDFQRFLEIANDLTGKPNVEPGERHPGEYIGSDYR